MRRSIITAVALIALTGVTTTSCSSGSVSRNTATADGCPDNASQGITDTSVKIGESAPLSGQAANSGPLGLQAYVDFINSQGGVKMSDGRTRSLDLVVLDDAYDPAKAVTNARKLVDDEKVFATVFNFGTAANLAARPIYNKSCTPSLYVGSGDAAFADPKEKWMFGNAIVANVVDARAAATFIETKHPGASVATLVQDDELGKSLEEAFVTGLKSGTSTVVKSATFSTTDTTLTSQITTLAASKADVFVMLAGGTAFELQALEAVQKSGWEPEIKYPTNFNQGFLEKLSEPSRKGVYYGQYSKNPSDPKWADDKFVQRYLEWYAKQGGNESFNNITGSIGFQVGAMLVDNLGSMSSISRAGLADAASKYTLTADDTIFLPGVQFKIDRPSEPFGIADEVIVTYDPTGSPGGMFKSITTVHQRDAL